MNKQTMLDMFNNAKGAVKKHSPEILTGIGISGMLTSTVLAVKATPKAMRLLDAEYRKKRTNKMTTKAVIKTTWKCYVPSSVLSAVSITCLVGASSISVRRNAALATAYTISETALKEYKSKVIDTIGEKKEQEVRDAIAKDKINNNPLSNDDIIMTSNGSTLCYDTISGRYFKSDIEALKKVSNELSRQLLTENAISLNQFYYEIGLDCAEVGYILGWNIDDGLIELSLSSQLTTKDEPCLVLDFKIPPRYGYQV